MAMLMQNANSANVAPDSAAVARGLGREDLFTCVHEQFMTATAQYADILLPAAMFLEYDDIYYGLGHTHLTVGPAVLDRYEDCRTNHELVCALAQRLGSNHAELRHERRRDCWTPRCAPRAAAPGTRRWRRAGSIATRASRRRISSTASRRSDGRFHFKPDWKAVGPYHAGMKPLPDHLENYERASEELPFRLVVPPARAFLNTTFTETPGSASREGEPRALIHEQDAARLGVGEGSIVLLGNGRGAGARCARGRRRRPARASSSSKATGRAAPISTASASTC